jgi:uncharacterized iron-regulated membrane protein
MLVLHRWAGLSMALFLLVAGLTGAVLAWREPLEALVAPGFHHAPARGTPLPAVALRARAEALAGAPVDFLPLDIKEGTAVVLGVSGSDIDEIALDPVTGAELGRRQWGNISQGRINLIPFLYRLHYSVAAGDVGSWLMGVVALLWTVDCFVGFALTWPRGSRRWWPRWRKAWRISAASQPRLVYDSHRASGLWLWPILLLFAWSSVGFNLPQAYSPLMTAALGHGPEIPVQPAITGPADWPAAEPLGRAALARMAAREGLTHAAPAWLRLDRAAGQWIVGFRSERDLTGAHAAGRLYLSADGRELGVRLPTGQSARTTVESWLFGLHMGAGLGLWWRIALVPIGLGIAALSVTGVLIWWRKRRATRAKPAERQTQLPPTRARLSA